MFPKVSETSLATWDHVEPSLIIPVSLDQKFLSVVEFSYGDVRSWTDGAGLSYLIGNALRHGDSERPIHVILVKDNERSVF